MNSTHDLGGTHGHGPIDRRQNENFAHPWEQKVFGLTLACGMLGRWNLDESRFARERVHPGEYLLSSYYEHWLHGLEALLLDKGLVTAEELATGIVQTEVDIPPIAAAEVAARLAAGGPTTMETDRPAGYRPGDVVRIRRGNPATHTRVPRYIRGCTGTIRAHYGAHVFPDPHASSGCKTPAHLYSIAFGAAQLWGVEDSEPRTQVCVDVFEPYIEGVVDAA